MAARSTRTPKTAGKFLTALREGATVAGACKAAKIGRSTAYEWRGKDEDFAAAWDEALEDGTDALEDEAKRRGADGVDEPVFYQGKQVSTVTKYSDTLLMFLLKGRRPEKFKDRHEHTGADGGPIETREMSNLEFARRVAFVLAQGIKDDDAAG